MRCGLRLYVDVIRDSEGEVLGYGETWDSHGSVFRTGVSACPNRSLFIDELIAKRVERAGQSTYPTNSDTGRGLETQ